MRTAVIILNWNTKSFLSQFLPSLIESIATCDAEIIVADNGSNDGSVDLLKRDFSQLHRIELDRNYGFTGGYNRAVAKILSEENTPPEYIALVNSDISAEKAWLEPLLAHLDTHPECGVCGPKILALEKDFSKSKKFEYAGAAGGYIDKYGFPFCRGRVLKRTEIDSGQYDRTQQVLWVSGACLLTRTSLWQELGGLDERFFAHMEEIDYCWRAQIAGYSTQVISDSAVYHLGGGTLANDSPFKLKLNFRNSLLCLSKNLPSDIASKRIRTRLMMDNCAAFLYFLSGKVSNAKAVIQAHKEFKALRGASSNTEAITVKGIWNKSIIFQSALRGKAIFEYLKKFE